MSGIGLTMEAKARHRRRRRRRRRRCRALWCGTASPGMAQHGKAPLRARRRRRRNRPTGEAPTCGLKCTASGDRSECDRIRARARPHMGGCAARAGGLGFCVLARAATPPLHSTSDAAPCPRLCAGRCTLCSVCRTLRAAAASAAAATAAAAGTADHPQRSTRSRAHTHGTSTHAGRGGARRTPPPFRPPPAASLPREWPSARPLRRSGKLRCALG